MTTTPQKLDNKYKESKAAELLMNHGKTTAGIIGMGRVLTEVKEALPHGEFTEWLKRYCPIANTTSLNYRRSFALATSTNDFGSVKLEIMALYYCARIHDDISKPIHKDPDLLVVMQTGLKAVLTAARKQLIDEDAAVTIYVEAASAKHAELNAAKAAPETQATPVTDQSEADATDRCDGNDEPVLILVPAPRQFSEALQMVMRQEFDNQWIEQAKAVGETEFRKFAAHVNAALKTFDATSNVVKLKADRAEAKTKSK
jgi:Protein of unknown function (DUF3102)